MASHSLSHVSASFLSCLPGTSLPALDLTLNAHLQINSFRLWRTSGRRRRQLQSQRAENQAFAITNWKKKKNKVAK